MKPLRVSDAAVVKGVRIIVVVVIVVVDSIVVVVGVSVFFLLRLRVETGQRPGD